jgi:hypothetical protein
VPLHERGLSEYEQIGASFQQASPAPPAPPAPPVQYSGSHDRVKKFTKSERADPESTDASLQSERASRGSACWPHGPSAVLNGGVKPMYLQNFLRIYWTI